MSIIHETNNFLVVAHDQPHHDRDNGGHSKIVPKENFTSREEMPLDLYISMMVLVRATGEAVTKVMRQKGIPIVRINYQDNGNWSYFPSMNMDPKVHVHLYARSKNESHPNNDPRFEAFPEALFFPFRGNSPEYYQDFKSYTQEDCRDIGDEIKLILLRDEFSDFIESL